MKPDIFVTPFKYSVEFEFSIAATCRQWVSNSSKLEIFRMFKSRKTPSRNAPMRAIELLAKMSNSDISPVTKVVSLETLYKSDSNIDALPAVLKIIGKIH